MKKKDYMSKFITYILLCIWAIFTTLPSVAYDLEENMKQDALKLMLVTNKGDTPLLDYLKFIEACADAGITSVELREKGLNFKELLEFGQELQKILQPKGIPLIINDSLDLCLKLKADGLHLGQEDGNIAKARAALGPDKILGVTVNTLKQLETANNEPVDYVGIGAIFPTKNKINVKRVWGVKELAEAVPLSRHPVVAIGGIDQSNAEAVMKAGVAGIAAIGVFHDAIDPASATKNMHDIVEKTYVTQD